MKTRSLKELLIILRDNGEQLIEDVGLCWATIKLRPVISEDEYLVLDQYLEDNLPPRTYCYGGEYVETVFSFPPGEWPPREAWLNDQIKNYPNE